VTHYLLPGLPYDYSALEPSISAQIMELHHGKHHAAYVAGANTTLDKLVNARESESYSDIVGLEKTVAFNVSGHVLHSIFWQNLSPDGRRQARRCPWYGGRRELWLVRQLQGTAHGGANTVQGSGWEALAWAPLGGRLIIEQAYDHHSSVANGSLPLLVFDAWEHAYHLQYKNVKADFVSALWNVVNWDDVAKRFEAATNEVIS
jgi:Fe-Mn family superoxide dismutase